MRSVLLALLCAAWSVGCDDGPTIDPGDASRVDAGTGRVDSGPRSDAGPDFDAGPAFDAGPFDAGPVAMCPA